MRNLYRNKYNMRSYLKIKKIAVLPGDDIGYEVMNEESLSCEL